MIDANTKIKCPECNTDIIINTYQLLAGASYSCGKCKTSISLANDSKDAVNKAMNELEQIKSKK